MFAAKNVATNAEEEILREDFPNQVNTAIDHIDAH